MLGSYAALEGGGRLGGSIDAEGAVCGGGCRGCFGKRHAAGKEKESRDSREGAPRSLHKAIIDRSARSV